MTAKEIIENASKSCVPDKGIMALADADYCIMDDACTCYPYKEDGRCLNYSSCDDPQYMLACLATREPDQLGAWAVERYNKAMLIDGLN